MASVPLNRRLTGARLMVALLVPWIFLTVFATLYVRVIAPNLFGHMAVAQACLGAFIGLVLISFTVAAVNFSRDVLAGRWPT